MSWFVRSAAVGVAAFLGASVWVGSAMAADAPIAPASASTWSIKGIALGSSPDALRASQPTAKCETFPDPTILSCTVATTLANGSATLHVKYFQNAAVLVSLEDITLDQAQAGLLALTNKYGVPASTTNVSAFNPNGDGFISVQRPLWEIGDVKMYLKVDQWQDKVTHVRYSAILLVNDRLHNGEWVPRYNNKSKAAAGDI